MSGSSSAVFWIIYAIVIIIMIAALWKVLEKAGEPGWGAIVPIYNIYLMIKIAGKPGWWLVLYFIPIANLVAEILVLIGIARNFGKSDAYAIGLIFLPFIFFPMLGFGSATYQSVSA